MAGEVAEAFLLAIKTQAEAGKLLSREHFSLDGTLVEAAASLKSFRPKEQAERKDGSGPSEGPQGKDGDSTPVAPTKAGRDRNPSVGFHGERRRNATHAPTTDPEALLAKHSTGEAARLAYADHLLTENRNGLIVQADLSPATGTAERDTGLELVWKERKERYSAIDGRTTSWAGYGMSQKKRKIVEEAFGWMKTVGLLRKLRHRGETKARWVFQFTAAAYNLVRMRSLLGEDVTG